MMKIDFFQKYKDIKEVETIDFSDLINSISSKQTKSDTVKNLSQVIVFRFKYRVNHLWVIGYCSIPKNSKKTYPSIIHLRGGSRDFGMLNKISLYNNLVKICLSGYVVVTTQYPGVEGGDGKDEFGGLDDIESIKELRNILKKIPCADWKKIGVKGHSRGGLMAYMLLREVNWINCAVIAGAPVDQVIKMNERIGWREHQIAMWGNKKSETIRRSPLHWFKDIPANVPILIMHGTSDWRVRYTHSLKMADNLIKIGAPCRLILFEGADHSITEFKEEYWNQSLNWFQRFLNNDEKIPDMSPHGE